MTRPDPTPLSEELAAELAGRPDEARLTEVWATLGALEPAAAPSTATADWEQLRARIDAGNAVQPLPLVQRTSRRRYLAVAAAAVVLVAAGVGLWPSGSEEILAPPGGRTRAELPDGSMIELDGASSVRFARSFRERTVTLSGVGFFEVKRDGRPFVVRTDGAEVRVVGTQFEVRARPGEHGGTRVEVAEGRVVVTGAGAESVELGAGQRTDVPRREGRPTPPTPVAADRIAPWRTGGFAAVDERLDHIVADLERHFGVPIVLRNRTAGAERLTLYYPAPTELTTMLRDLTTARGLRFRPSGRGFEVE